jgi:hypothetical protein
MRADNNAHLVVLPSSFDGLFTGRYAIKSGKRILDGRWKKKAITVVRSEQKTTPVKMLREGRRTLWYFHDKFYWDTDDLEVEDVKALVRRRERGLKQELQTAHSLMRAEANGRPARVGTPTDVRRAVFERDGGRCVECGSNFDLQYDHILPVALGGATSVENLQILCADCNRRKSDSI